MEPTSFSSVFNLIVFSIFFNFGSVAFAKSSCHSNSTFQNIENTQAYLHKAGVFDDADRKTAEEYATAHQTVDTVIKERFAASADILCGGMLGQAQIIIRRDVVVTAAHNIFKTGTCTPLAKLSTCKIQYEVAGKKLSVPLKKMIKNGYECPLKKDSSGKPRQIAYAEDIVSIRLQSPVDSNVKPYAITTKSIIEKQATTAVGKSQDFVRIDDNGKKSYPKHYGDCQIKDNWGGVATDMMGTNCDSSGYSSGGGLFKYTDLSEYAYVPPELLGILQGSSETKQQILAAKGKQINSGTYDAKTWDSWYIPISGSVLDSLKSMKPDSDSLPGLSL